MVTLITLVASFLSWHASLTLKRKFYATRNTSQSYSRRATALVWRKWKRFKILILCLRLLEVVILITLVASFLSWHASLTLKRKFYATGNTSQSYSRRATALVWRKWKRFKILILCLRLLEVVILITLVASFLSWHASLNLKRNFYVTGNSSQSYSLGGLQPWYGENVSV